MTVLATLLQQSDESLRSQAQSYLALLSSLHCQDDLAEMLANAEAWQHAPFATVPAHESLRPFFAAWAALAKQRAAQRILRNNCLLQQRKRRAKKALSVWHHYADGSSNIKRLLRKAAQHYAQHWLQRAWRRWRQQCAVIAHTCRARIAVSSSRCCSALNQWRIRAARTAAAKQAITRAVQASTALLLRQGLRAWQTAMHGSLRLQHAAAHAEVATVRRCLHSWHK
jgi:hypothetical protein